jgi:hypothetical protein
MSIILAKILGFYFLALGLAFFLNTNRLKNIYSGISKDENFLFMGGILALLIGAVIVSIHNEWVWGWPVIITVLGWWSLIKGFTLFAYPDFIKLFSFLENQSDLFYKTISLFYIVLALFLLYKGYSS